VKEKDRKEKGERQRERIYERKKVEMSKGERESE